MYQHELIAQDPTLPAFVPSGTSPAPADAGPRRARLPARWFAALWREPLTHFVLFGLLIFLVAHGLEARSKRYSIAVTPADVTRIVNAYVQQYGVEPGPDQLRTMVDNYIREEVYLREGLALGLDKDDEIVRRRIAQKYDFLQQDMATPREPSEGDLKAYYAAHGSDFLRPEKRSFDQVYFAGDQRGDAAARTLAEASLPRLAAGGPVAGDEFPGPKVISNLTREDTGRLFGGSSFPAEVFAAPPGKWVGPYRSGFGWHLVKITEIGSAAPRSFDDARADVRAAWIEADRRTRNDEGYRKLLARYAVTRADSQP